MMKNEDTWVSDGLERLGDVVARRNSLSQVRRRGLLGASVRRERAFLKREGIRLTSELLAVGVPRVEVSGAILAGARRGLVVIA